MSVKLHLVFIALLLSAPLRAGTTPALDPGLAGLRFAGIWPDLAPAQTPHPAVVRVIAPEGLAMSLGSGTLVDRNDQHGLVVTNWHVVRDARGPVEVVFPGGFRSKATIIRTDRDWDLAALLIARPPVDPVPLSTAVPKPGDALRIAGYGSGKYRMQSGRCTQYLSPGRNKPFEMIEVSAVARQGDSGGPILNERDELAGVLFGANSSGTSGSYGGRVHQFLQLASNDLQKIPTLHVAQHNESPATGARPPRVALPPPPSDTSTVNERQTLSANSLARPAAAFAGQVLSPGELPPQPDNQFQTSMEPSPLYETPASKVAREALPRRQPEATLPVAIEAAASPADADTATGAWFVWGEELKTILAAFGVAAILLHVLRWIAAARN